MSREAERELAIAAKGGDMKAREQLFRQHAALVKWISFKFHGPDMDDLFAAGSEGWMHALRTWNPKGKAGIKMWVTLWVRAYAGRATRVHLYRKSHEMPFVLPSANSDGEALEADASDDGIGVEEMTDDLWRRQAHGIIDSMKDRRLAVVLQDRMRGYTLEEIGVRRGRELRTNGTKGAREWVRRLEQLALNRAKAIARASA